ncbi:uncharacterized protein LOC112270050 [Brachypodium distachyon]|uniref:uncharacterized protein LOC112270050 n=1 Tax=Brachypodium distachyon TaxID=15368 RepID=UPI000D0D5528|nr:uncharacterized protein LOC112270050 [Brachypodium distachyon]|eukprot:XP_024313476.1 uncharacterized protein LOC112270050 [Brachypodium distachyon]
MIWVSTQDGVTYSFDTTSGMWSNAGKWPLPFHGGAEYAPEHGLWFGFTSHSQGQRFAASDLAAASTMTPPVLHKAWNEPLPKHWVQVLAPYRLPLGSGKFCIGRVFDDMEEEGRTKEMFAVFTGVEVECRGSRGALRLIKHKSKRFSVGRRMVKAIL